MAEKDETSVVKMLRRHQEQITALETQLTRLEAKVNEKPAPKTAADEDDEDNFGLW